MFYGDYAPVVKDGKAYLIDRNFNRVSDMIDGTAVASYGNDTFGIQTSDGLAFLTYTDGAASDDTSKPAESTSSKPTESTSSKPAETSSEPAESTSSKPTESTSSKPADDHDKENPKTGVTVAAVAVGLAALAGAAVVVYRKKK